MGGLLLLLSWPALAAATPATVDLRIEGKTRTLYEGRVTTDIRTIDVHDGTGPHTCDGTNNGANPSPAPTRGAAFATAAEGPGGFPFRGTYFASFDDVAFEEVAGENVRFDPGTGTFLVEYENGVPASVGSCQDQIAGGERLVYAIGTGGEPVLALAGPVTVGPGEPAAVRVTDAASGAPIGGAEVGGRTTAADGSAHVPVAERGATVLKASKAGSIRSNAIVVCSTDGSDGACGSAPPAAAFGPGPTGGAVTPQADREAPQAFITGIAEQEVFRRGRGPRELTGLVGHPTRSLRDGVQRAGLEPDPSGLLMVKLRLTRTDGKRCTYFSGRFERFRRNRRGRCGASNGYWLRIGDDARWSYLLPERLPRGRYVLDVNAIDKAYNRDDERRRRQNRIVFHVR